MTHEEYLKYANEYGVARETIYCNDIEFALVTLKDGWIEIFKRHETLDYYQPMIQAKNMSKAKDYCYKTERCPTWVKKLVE